MDLETAALVATVALPLAGALAGGARWISRRWRRIARFLDDWNGEPARPGVLERPGVMTRLARTEEWQTRTDGRLDRIEVQVFPNHGNSLHDKVQAINDKMEGSE